MGLLENFHQEGEGLNGSLREQQGLGKFCCFIDDYFFSKENGHVYRH